MATRKKADPVPMNKADELVEIRLFKDNEQYKDPLFVSVNGESVLIQRGVTVKVKRKFARVIEMSDKQDQMTGALMNRLAERYVQATAEKTKPE